MSVTTDHSLKLCRHFPAFLLFLWQSICRVVRKLKSCHRVTLPSQLSGRYCMKKKMANVHFLHLVNFTEFCPFYIRYYFVSSVGICQNRIPGIGLFWYFLKMFLIRARWSPRVKIRIQIPIILKTIAGYTKKCKPAPWVRFDFKSCRN